MTTEGKDQKTGRFLPGNRFWEARTTIGRPRLFDSPEALWAACCEYFDWVEANPLYEAKAFAYQGQIEVEYLPKMRAMTIGALCLFLDVNKDTWFTWAKTPVFSDVVARADEHIRQQKFAGASADLLNANIIARDLGLADKRELSGQVTVAATPVDQDL